MIPETNGHDQWPFSVSFSLRHAAVAQFAVMMVTRDVRADLGFVEDVRLALDEILHAVTPVLVGGPQGRIDLVVGSTDEYLRLRVDVPTTADPSIDRDMIGALVDTIHVAASSGRHEITIRRRR